MKTLTNDECRKIFREKVNADTTPVHDYDIICAINNKNVHETLDDQSGDPMVYKDRLIGIVTWVHPISDETGNRVLSGFTRISEYTDWIHDQLEWAE